jgi:Transposase DDE domain
MGVGFGSDLTNELSLAEATSRCGSRPRRWRDGERPPPSHLPDAAIAAALTVRAAYRLALRQAEGLVRFIFALLGLALPVPDRTTLSRRGRALLHLDRCADAGGGLDLAIDSTDLRLARPPGAASEAWRKLHIAVDRTAEVLAEELTRSDVHDTVLVAGMLGRIAGPLRRVYGGRLAEGVFRPKAPDVRTAARLDSLTGRSRHALVVARDGRLAWARATGYGRRNAAEWTFSRLTRVLGGGLRSRSLEAQRAAGPYASQRALVFHPDDPLFQRFRIRMETEQGTLARPPKPRGRN